MRLYRFRWSIPKIHLGLNISEKNLEVVVSLRRIKFNPVNQRSIKTNNPRKRKRFKNISTMLETFLKSLKRGVSGVFKVRFLRINPYEEVKDV